ncbi:MAG TPA: energy-coupling factor transporter transmembrane component T [Microbacteriaceae bacterium]|nr:energy-coupling factor transporter transmembrane component T [Microbacteriaceae bacterium]
MNRHPFALPLGFLPTTVVVVAVFHPVVAAVSLALWLVILVLLGHAGQMRSRMVLAVLGAALVAGISMALYGRPSGAEIWRFGPAHMTEGSLDIAIATMLRIVAIAIPSIVIFRTLDATRFADALEQHVKLPARVVWAVFAGLRQLEATRDDWETVRMVRRARGRDRGWALTDAGAGLVGMFGLALDRGAELAVTLETRGVSNPLRRPSRVVAWRRRDTALLALGVTCAVVLVVVSWLVGGSIV